jgi:hypothetical protein
MAFLLSFATTFFITVDLPLLGGPVKKIFFSFGMGNG